MEQRLSHVIPPLDPLPFGPPEEKHTNEAGGESGDVGPEGDAAGWLAACRRRDRSDAAQELHQEPDAEEEDRRHLDDLDEDEQRQQRDDARVG